MREGKTVSEAIDPTRDPELNDRQRKFVEAIARGLSAQDAARSANYSPGYVRKASRLLKQPMIAKELELIRAKARDLAAYDVSVAMAEALDDHRFAVQKGNPMAAVKATELRSRLAGLLIDRVEIATVDLTSALAKAEARVLSITDAPLVTSKKPIDWRPHIPGSRIADREGGPADDESEAEVESARRIGK